MAMIFFSVNFLTLYFLLRENLKRKSFPAGPLELQQFLLLQALCLLCSLPYWENLELQSLMWIMKPEVPLKELRQMPLVLQWCLL